MMRRICVVGAALLAAGCQPPSAPPTAPAADEAAAPVVGPGAPETATKAPPPALVTPPKSGWELVSSGEGDALHYIDSKGDRPVILFCASGGRDLLVNVASFKPVGSEERMAFGADGTVVTLVADGGGDALRGGVSGQAPVPSELAGILAAPAGVRVNYGNQNVGPLPTIEPAAAKAFVAACGDA